MRTTHGMQIEEEIEMDVFKYHCDNGFEIIQPSEVYDAVQAFPVKKTNSQKNLIHSRFNHIQNEWLWISNDFYQEPEPLDIVEAKTFILCMDRQFDEDPLSVLQEY